MIGDRLDTDIEGGRAAGLATLVVFTGVSDAAEVLAAPPARRPDFLGADLTALACTAEALAPGPRAGWSAVRSAEPGGARTLVLSAHGADGEPLDALRVLCAAHWDTGGGEVTVEAADPAAQRALRALGLVADPAADPASAASTTVDDADTGLGARR